jgi:arylsulfatase A-like enzyme
MVAACAPGSRAPGATAVRSGVGRAGSWNPFAVARGAASARSGALGEQAPVSRAVSATAPSGSGSPAAAAPAGPPNVVLVTIDSLRADMPWNGYPKPIAPRLTAFARQAVSYARGYAIASVTAKSLGGLLSGRYPSELARTWDFFTAYAPENAMFAELLQAAGVRTVSAQAHWSLGPGRGYSQGFDVWRMVPGLASGDAANRQATAQLLTPIAIEVLVEAGRGAAPFFAWFHYTDPHPDYLAHAGAPSFGLDDRGQYDGEVWFTDGWVGKLIDFVDAQPWAAHTVVVVSSDHGEAFGEHRMRGHGFQLWEELVRVPWLVRAPGVAPRRIEAPRSHIDLAPTILEWFGVPAPRSMRGRSLAAEVRGGSLETRPILMDLPADQNADRRAALIEGSLKIVAFAADQRFSLYDLAADPRETRDLWAVQPERASEMLGAYRRTWAGLEPRGALGRAR